MRAAGSKNLPPAGEKPKGFALPLTQEDVVALQRLGPDLFGPAAFPNLFAEIVHGTRPTSPAIVSGAPAHPAQVGHFVIVALARRAPAQNLSLYPGQWRRRTSVALVHNVLSLA